jgi:hypothetical protein
MTMHIITADLLANAYDFEQYRDLHAQHVTEGRTSGPVQTDELAHYTKLNLSRVNRILKTTELLPDVADRVRAIDRPMTWLVIAETWCGDVAQSVPVLAQLAALNPRITFRIILRDEHPEVIGQFLTNGARSIPKVILLDEDLTILADWGPRPAALQPLMLADAAAGLPLPERIENVHRWYAQDHAVSIQREFAEVLGR